MKSRSKGKCPAGKSPSPFPPKKMAAQGPMAPQPLVASKKPPMVPAKATAPFPPAKKVKAPKKFK